MKLQIDTTNKKIRIEEEVNLLELTDTLERLLPDGQWKEFTLETQIITNWQQPIIIRDYAPWQPLINQPYIPSPNYPWYTTCGDSTGNVELAGNATLKDGVYNVVS